MKDLTTGPVSRHLLATTGFMLVMTWIWILSVATVWVQLGVSLSLLRREFTRRLGTSGAPVPLAAAGA